ncbi:MAG TPA: dihydropteroate synthase, partial [Nocardioides sp.]|nr:dihydropteroate synthase [Nocardioides sp.]
MRPAPLPLRGRTFDAGRPAVMAIINRTRDSFYAPARHAVLDAALDAMDDAVAGGADIVDIGAV